MLKVFLSHDSADKPLVQKLAFQLREEGFEPWLDKWDLIPGERWQEGLEKGLETSDVCLIFIGSQGKGPWHEAEMRAMLDRSITRKGLRVIPVLLPDAPEDAISKLPPFLQAYNGVRFHQSVEEPDTFNRLVAGIRNEKPGPDRDIYSDTLPPIQGDFIGRKPALQLLNNLINSKSDTNIIQLVGMAGVGKTALVRYWLDQTKESKALITWSFSSNHKQDPTLTASFFNVVYKLLGASRTEFMTEEEKGENLAKLLHKHHCILILDGLDSIQSLDESVRGQLKDRAMEVFLDSLANHNAGLCVITSRLSVPKLKHHPRVVNHKLEALATDEAIELLKLTGVTGETIGFTKAVKLYGGNPLILSILGNYAKSHLDGDVSKINSIPKPEKDNIDEAGRIETLLSLYKQKLTGSTPLGAVMLLSMFNEPPKLALLNRLRAAAIPNITAGFSDRSSWSDAIGQLESEGFILAKGENGKFVHPIVRNYFRSVLISEYQDSYAKAKELIENYLEIDSSTICLKRSEVDPQFKAESIAYVMAELIPNIDSGAESLIGIFGNWGRGKTYLMDLIWNNGSSLEGLGEEGDSTSSFKKDGLSFFHRVKNKLSDYFYKKFNFSNNGQKRFGEVDVIRVNFHSWKYQNTPQIWSFLYQVLIEKYLEPSFSNGLVNELHSLLKIFLLNLARKGVFPIVSFFGIVVFFLIWYIFIPIKIKFDVVLYLGLGGVLFLLFAYSRLPSAIKLAQDYTGIPKVISFLGTQKLMQDEIRILLRNWVNKENKKILLFVDDLDRCSVNKIVDLIDSLRVIIDDEEISSKLIIFVAIDERILRMSIKEKYASLNEFSDNDQLDKISHEYLDKIFLVGVRLGVINNAEKESYLESLTSKYCDQNENYSSSPSGKEKESHELGKSIVSEDYLEIEDEEVTINSEKISISKLKLGEGITLTKTEQLAILEMSKYTPDSTPRQLKVLYFRFVLCKRLLKENYDPLDVSHAKFILYKIIKRTIQIRIDNKLISNEFSIPSDSVSTHDLNESDVDSAVDIVVNF